MLAERLGITQRRLARIEAGGPIPAELILRLIDVTGVSPRWLLSGEGERFVAPGPDRLTGRDRGARPV
jgi:transcriptional regulator with XRE-family HTH domain